LIAEAVLGIKTRTVVNVTEFAMAESALNAPAAEFGGVECASRPASSSTTSI
jgi:hypothetical protein